MCLSLSLLLCSLEFSEERKKEGKALKKTRERVRSETVEKKKREEKKMEKQNKI